MGEAIRSSSNLNALYTSLQQFIPSGINLHAILCTHVDYVDRHYGSIPLNTPQMLLTANTMIYQRCYTQACEEALQIGAFQYGLQNQQRQHEGPPAVSSRASQRRRGEIELSDYLTCANYWGDQKP